MVSVAGVDELVLQVEQVDRMVLVALSEQGRVLPPAPAFRGRCLDPAYLEAVASGAWSLDDEAVLARTEERLEQVALPRVRMLDRRHLRTVLRSTVLAVLTEDLVVPQWQDRRQALLATWLDVVGPLPLPRVSLD